jgi:hypothetical protein
MARRRDPATGRFLPAAAKKPAAKKSTAVRFEPHSLKGGRRKLVR